MLTPLSRAFARATLLLVWTVLLTAPPAARAQDGAGAESTAADNERDGRRIDVYSQWLSHAVGQTVEETAAWVDSRFGNRRPPNERHSFGYVRVVPLWVEHRGWEYDTRLRARIELPNLSRRLHAAFGAGDTENFVTDRPVLAELDEMSLTKERFNDRSFLAGLGYALHESERSSLSLGGGIKVHFPLEPYVRARYVRVMPMGESTFLRFQQTVYARTQRGQGSVTGFDVEHVLAPRLLGRASVYAHFSTWDERPQEFGGEVSVARALSRNRIAAITAFSHLQPKAEVGVQDYGVRLIYRQRLSGRHLYGEIHTGYTWPRYTLADERRASLNLGIGLELHFGQERDPRRAGEFIRPD